MQNSILVYTDKAGPTEAKFNSLAPERCGGNSNVFFKPSLPNDILSTSCEIGLMWVPQNHVNTLRPRQDGRHFPDNIFKCIFLNENV